MQYLSLEQCQSLGPFFYAVVDKNYHWRVTNKHGKSYIDWTTGVKTCEALVKKETQDAFADVLKEKRLSIFKKGSHVYIVLALKEVQPKFVQTPALRYDFERQITRRLSLLQIAGLLVAGGGLLLLFSKSHKINKLQQKILDISKRSTAPIVTNDAQDKLYKEAILARDQLQETLTQKCKLSDELQKKIQDTEKKLRINEEMLEVLSKEPKSQMEALQKLYDSSEAQKVKSQKEYADLQARLDYFVTTTNKNNEGYVEQINQLKRLLSKKEAEIKLELEVTEKVALEIQQELEDLKTKHADLKKEHAGLQELNQLSGEILSFSKKLEEENEQLKKKLRELKEEQDFGIGLGCEDPREEKKQTPEKKKEQAKPSDENNKKCWEGLAQKQEEIKASHELLQMEEPSSKVAASIQTKAKKLLADVTVLLKKTEECKNWSGECTGFEFCAWQTVTDAIRKSRSDLLNTVQVFVRINPIQKLGEKSITNAESASGNNTIQLSDGSSYKNMDIYDTSYESNEKLFKGKKDLASIEESINNVLQGYSQVILGFGVSGSGKTYTIFGKTTIKPNKTTASKKITTKGIFQLAISKLKAENAKVKFSIFEEYVREFDSNKQTLSGKVIFLMDECELAATFTDKKITVEREHVPFKRASIVGKLTETDFDLDDLQKITNQRVNKYRIKPTPNNIESSRSHLYIVLKCTTKNGTVGYLTFVDMAGVERPYDVYTNLIRFNENLKSRKFELKPSMIYNDNTFKTINEKTVLCLDGSIRNSWTEYFKTFPSEFAVEKMQNVVKAPDNKASMHVHYISSLNLGKVKGESGCKEKALPKQYKFAASGGGSLKIDLQQNAWFHDMLKEGFYINESLNYMKSFMKNEELSPTAINLFSENYGPDNAITAGKAHNESPPTKRIFDALDTLADPTGGNPTRFTFIFLVMPGIAFLKSNVNTLDMACSLLPTGTTCKVSKN
jgi:hypothetical protein